MRKLISNNIHLLKVIKGKGFYHLMSANFLIRFLGFSSQILVAWILTPDDIGRIKVMQSFMSVFIVLAGFGFNVSILKLCSEDRSDLEKNYLFRKGLLYSFVPQIITFIFILICINNQWLSSDSTINSIFIIFALGIFPLTLDSNILSYLQSLKKIKEYAGIQVVTKPIGVLLLVGFTYFFALRGYAIAIVIGYVITLVVILIRNNELLNKGIEVVSSPFKVHSNYAYYSALTNVIGIILISVDIFALNYLSKEMEEIGYYSFATVFIGMLAIITRTVLQISHPHFSEKSKDFSNLISSFNKYEKAMNAYLLLIFVSSVILVPLFMTFIYNGKYSDSIYYFVILAIAWLVRDASAFRGSALFGLGKIQINFLTNLISLVFHLIFVVLSYYYFGIKGTPFGMVLGAVVTYILSYSLFSYTIAKEQSKI